MKTAIKIDKITKKFGNRTVLNEVSLETYAGEVFGLLGPNGAGKTTLIKLITGLLKIEEGDIQIYGKSLESDFEEAMKNMGAIVENPEMYKYMTGKQNILQYARMRGNITPERIDEVVELVGLSNRINEKVGKYSLGMRQRLGVALSLLHNPKVLILDEPTNGLDPAGIKHLRDVLTTLAHQHDVCVIVSSHLMSEMELMCDRVGIISNGNIINVDTVENLMKIAAGTSVTYSYEVSNFEAAKTLITDYNKELKVEMADNHHFDVMLPAEDNKNIAANIIALLVNNNVSVYAVIPKENQKLEDAFIEITNAGGDQIA